MACASVLFRVLPLRISPPQPQVEAGQATTLTAISGGTISAEWVLKADVGTISAAGEYTATTSIADAGPIPVEARFGSMVAEESLFVTGEFPGVVHRTFDFIDERQKLPTGWYAQSVAVSGNRAYVLGGIINAPTADRFIDVFDVTDPGRPLWVDSVEAESGTNLYTWGNPLYLMDASVYRVAAYDISTGRPEIATVLNLPPFYNALAFDQGTFFAFAGNHWNATDGTDSVLAMDVSTGSLALAAIDLRLPPDAASEVFRGYIGGSKDRIAVSYTNSPGATMPTFAAVYDRTAVPLRFMGFVTPWWNRFTFHDSLLFTPTHLYDVSGAEPEEVASTPLQRVESINGPLVAGRDINAALVVLDVTDPQHPVTAAKITDFDSLFFAVDAVWAGDHILTTNRTGGLTSIRPTPKGGPVLLAAPGSYAGVSDFDFDASYAYTAGPTSTTTVQVFDITGSATLVSQYSEGQDAFAIRKKGSYLYVGMSDHLSVLDASSPSALKLAGKVAVPTSYMAIDNNLMVLASLDGRLITFERLATGRAGGPRAGCHMRHSLHGPDLARTGSRVVRRGWRAVL